MIPGKEQSSAESGAQQQAVLTADMVKALLDKMDSLLRRLGVEPQGNEQQSEPGLDSVKNPTERDSSEREAETVVDVSERLTDPANQQSSRAQPDLDSRSEGNVIAAVSEQLQTYGAEESVDSLVSDWKHILADLNGPNDLTAAEKQEIAARLADIENRVGPDLAKRLVSDALEHSPLFKDVEPTALAQARDEVVETAAVAIPPLEFNEAQQSVAAVADSLSASSNAVTKYGSPATELDAGGRASGDQDSVERDRRSPGSDPDQASRTYFAEEFNIITSGNTGTITDKSGNVLFQYERTDSDDIAVRVDNLSRSQYDSFLKAHQNIEASGLDQIMQDPAGRSQVENLGALAPEGAHAIAVSSLVLEGDTTRVSRGGFTFERKGQIYEVNRDQPDLPYGERLVATSAPSGKIVGQQRPGEGERFASKYQQVKEEVQRREKAAVQSTPKLKLKNQGRER